MYLGTWESTQESRKGAWWGASTDTAACFRKAVRLCNPDRKELWIVETDGCKLPRQKQSTKLANHRIFNTKHVFLVSRL